MAGIWAIISVIAIFTLLLAACQPAPAPTPTEMIAPVTPPPVPTATLPPTAPPDYSVQLQNQVWALVAMGDPANPAVVEAGTVVTAAFGADSKSWHGRLQQLPGSYTCW
jgi:hypothetical protein